MDIGFRVYRVRVVCSPNIEAPPPAEVEFSLQVENQCGWGGHLSLKVYHNPHYREGRPQFLEAPLRYEPQSKNS